MFVPVEISTTIPAAELVKFAQVKPGQKVLDVACGTGVVAVTAACRGAKASGLDLSPVLLERARHNARVAEVDIEFVEGDAEALPYPDASFDVVLSQFGHIFAPRPAVALKEMLRVLKPGGRIAFSTWPPEHFTGRMFTFIAGYLPPPPPGAEAGGAAGIMGRSRHRPRTTGRLRDRRGFRTQRMVMGALSLHHFRIAQEKTIGPLTRIVASLQNEPAKLAQLRADFEAMAREIYSDNTIRMPFLMTRATKA